MPKRSYSLNIQAEDTRSKRAGGEELSSLSRDQLESKVKELTKRNDELKEIVIGQSKELLHELRQKRKYKKVAMEAVEFMRKIRYPNELPHLEEFYREKNESDGMVVLRTPPSSVSADGETTDKTSSFEHNLIEEKQQQTPMELDIAAQLTDAQPDDDKLFPLDVVTGGVSSDDDDYFSDPENFIEILSSQHVLKGWIRGVSKKKRAKSSDDLRVSYYSPKGEHGRYTSAEDITKQYGQALEVDKFDFQTGKMLPQFP